MTKITKENNSPLRVDMKNWMILCVVFVGISCTNVIYNKPDNLISKEKMTEIWTDIMLGSAAKSLQTKDLRNYKNLMPVILKKYGIDSVQFVTSNRYYTTQIDAYEKIFEGVENRLKELKRRYDPKGAELDSIQKNYNLEPKAN